MRPLQQLAVLGLVATLSPAARADEGMWLFNDFPAAQVGKAHGFTPDAAWLDKVRLGSLRLANGCSASIVSSRGLVMTNHHCIRACLEDLSTPQRDLLSSPFVAKADAEEERCTKLEANQLLEIQDVTARVQTATKDLAGAAYKARYDAEKALIEGECAAGDAKRRCDLVKLFDGARFHLYRYQRFQDVRMVVAPEFQMAAFGGDPDNFNFPRYGFDAAFLRIYEDGKPAATPTRLPWAAKPVKENDLVFVSGHPGGTERLATVSQLEFQRDTALPWSLLFLAELRGRLDSWMQQSPERTRVARSKLREIENGLKALRGRHQTLADPAFMDRKRAQELALRSAAPENTRPAWDAVSKAMDEQRRLWAAYRLRESESFASDLFGHARLLVRLHAERAKPNAERLPEFTDARLPAIQQRMLAAAPIHKELETAMLAWSLARLRNLMGADDAFVKEVFGRSSPEQLAAQLVEGTRLQDPAFRKELLEAKELKVAVDPMLAFAARVDAAGREARKAYEERVEAVLQRNAELLADARRAVIGATGYPDATFTLRLSYGRVQGTSTAPSMTTMAGLFDRATGQPPFLLADSWQKASKSLKPETPMDVATTNDIIGGNSGSPLLNKDGAVVGLVFDGNLASLGGRFGYDPVENRTVAVHGDAILAALQHVYGADRIVKELRAKP